MLSLANALRRRLPLALGVASLLGTAAALLVWLLVPRDVQVKAYLHVSRLDPKVFQAFVKSLGAIDPKESLVTAAVPTA